MKTKITLLFILTAVVILGLCAEPNENMALPMWIAIMAGTKTAAFAAAWGMYKILNSIKP